MKLKIIVLSALLLAGCQDKDKDANPQSADKDALTTQEQRLSYSLGINIGEKLKANIEAINFDSFNQGIEDAYQGTKPLLTQDEIKDTLVAFQQQQMEKAKAKVEAEAQTNKTAGDTFLASNAKQEGVVTLASGLQYKIIKAAEGSKPALTDQVTVHYKGTLIDGTVFDSSYERGQPASFQLNSVIPGWQEALQLMPVGSKWMLYIPSDSAYGPGGTGGAIGPNSTLIFEVELISIGDDKKVTEEKKS